MTRRRRRTHRPTRRAVGLGALTVLTSGLIACTRPGSTPPVAPPEPFPTGRVDTATLLPYGARYDDGRGGSTTLERVGGPALQPTGPVAFSDPGAFAAYPAVPVATFTETLPCEVGVLAFPSLTTGQDPARRAATVAFGDVPAVRHWEQAEEDTWFGVDAGTGALYDVAAKPRLDDLPDAEVTRLFDTVIAEQVGVLALDGRAVAVAFDCGMGDGSYPVYRGFDADGHVAAVAADLELHHHLRRIDG